MAPVSRIAPTPSGYLHTGNIFNFIYTWLLVKSQNGLLHLRIDDLDNLRANHKYISDIFDTLFWLGLTYDKGPINIEEQNTKYSQQFRKNSYDTLLNKLAEKELIYACTCSRKEIEVSGADIYPGTCRNKHIPLDTPGVAWRVKTNPDELVSFTDQLKGPISFNLHEQMGDFVVRRKDGITSYQIASLADDITFGINLIVRGEDLIPSTAAQMWLASRLELAAFKACSFYHHGLLTEDNGNKLSKSAGSDAVSRLRLSGLSVSDLIALFCKWRKLETTASSLNELLTGYRTH